MLTKIVLKLMLKVAVPVVCVVGIMSYGMYMRGGDPAALFTKLIGSSVQSVKSSVKGAGDSLKSASPIKPSNKTTVYKWVDEYGVTQFGSAPPEGVSAQAKTYDNNANLMDAQKPVARQAADNDDQMQSGFGPDGERLPGMAGVDLPVAVDPAVLSEFLQTMQQQQ